MISVVFLLLYTGFLVVVGGGEIAEAVVPAELRDPDAPFEGGDGGVLAGLETLANIVVGVIKLAWGLFVLMLSLVFVDLAAFGIDLPHPLMRLVIQVPVTLATIHILWNVVGMIRGYS